MTYKIYTSKSNLQPEEFIRLARAVGFAKRTYRMDEVRRALKKSAYIVTVRDEKGKAIACGRALSDDLFYTTIPDVFVHPKHQRKGIGRKIMQKITDRFQHTTIYFGSKPGKGKFFEKLGFKKGLQSYSMN